MLDPPRIILLPTVHHYAVSAKVAHVYVCLVAVVGCDIDHEIDYHALRFYVRTLQVVLANDLQDILYVYILATAL